MTPETSPTFDQVTLEVFTAPKEFTGVEKLFEDHPQRESEKRLGATKEVIRLTREAYLNALKKLGATEKVLLTLQGHPEYFMNGQSVERRKALTEIRTLNVTPEPPAPGPSHLRTATA